MDAIAIITRGLISSTGDVIEGTVVSVVLEGDLTIKAKIEEDLRIPVHVEVE